MEPQGKQFTTVVGNQTITFETGKLAGQSNGAVTIRVGDSVIFASAVMSNNTREGIDFFPLSVEYEERLYAGGRIPGSFFRREGRPDDEAVLTARLTDRPLRPLFDQNMRNEVQIMSFPISADFENMIDIMVVNAASAALTISDIPWAGPVGAVRIGRVDGEFVINPTFEQLAVSNLDLRVAGTRDAILMVESGSDETSEDDMIAAITLAHEAIQPLVDVQEKMAAEVGKPKRVVEIKQPDQSLFEQVYSSVKDGITALLDKPPSESRIG